MFVCLYLMIEAIVHVQRFIIVTTDERHEDISLIFVTQEINPPHPPQHIWELLCPFPCKDLCLIYLSLTMCQKSGGSVRKAHSETGQSTHGRSSTYLEFAFIWRT